MKQFLIFICASLCICLSLHSQQKSRHNSHKEFTILFIGNSLTYTNNLPKLVEEYAASREIEIRSKMHAFPNYSIEDHWHDGQVQKLISSKLFDFVVIQQGPSSQPKGRQMLINYGEKYGSLCKLNRAQLCYFMVWPALEYYHTFEGVIKNHRDAAEANHSILLPVGERWKEHTDKSPHIGYYGDDGFHPSVKGSQMAAKVIVDHLFQP